jgi:hypothetical protein
MPDGVFPLVAAAEGKTGQALAVVRTGAGDPPAATARLAELVSHDLANPTAERAYLGAGFRTHQHVGPFRPSAPPRRESPRVKSRSGGARRSPLCGVPTST